MNNKIGVGVITCNRLDFFKKCINSIPNVDTLIVVNDGLPYSNDAYPSNVKEVIQHSTNKCVGISKNETLRYLIQDNCQHIFLVEDDMLIVDNNVFNEYIKTAKTTGLGRLSFGYHGPANKHPQTKQPIARTIIEYPNDVGIALNRHNVGSFCYFNKNVVKAIGYFDERYVNAWEHISHDMEAIKQGFMPAYWWWPDVYNSFEYINEIACSEVNSVIRKTPEWTRNMQLGAGWFKHNHGYFPTEVPDTPIETVKQKLKEIYNKYAIKQ